VLVCLLVGYVDGWANENFAVVYFYLIDTSVPFFTTVAFSCFEVEVESMVGAFYACAV
jgi:hypothetical protein